MGAAAKDVRAAFHLPADPAAYHVVVLARAVAVETEKLVKEATALSSLGAPVNESLASGQFIGGFIVLTPHPYIGRTSVAGDGSGGGHGGRAFVGHGVGACPDTCIPGEPR
jgi:hypothetical protein